MQSVTTNIVPLRRSQSMPGSTRANTASDNTARSHQGRELRQTEQPGAQTVRTGDPTTHTDLHARRSEQRYPEGFMDLGKTKLQKVKTCLRIFLDGFSRGVKKGAIAGAIAGGVTGAFIGASSAAATGPGAISMAITGFVGGVAGAGMGAGIGALIGGTITMCRSAIYLVMGQERRVKAQLSYVNSALTAINRRSLAGSSKKDDATRREALLIEQGYLCNKLEDVQKEKQQKLAQRVEEGLAKARAKEQSTQKNV